MKRGRWIAAVLGLLLAGAAAGWWFGSPWYTLHQMREAARARDYDALSTYIDYESVFHDMSRQMEHRGRGGHGLKAYARALVALVPKRERMLALLDPEAAGGAYGMEFKELELRRDGLDQFRLVRPAGGELVFRRHGLGWKLSGLQLPDDAPVLR